MIIPICFYCTHKVKGRLKCAAFGDNLIPVAILRGSNDHGIPLIGQKNILIFNSNQMVDLVPEV